MKKSSTYTYIVLAVSVLLIVGSIVCFFLLKKKSESVEENKLVYDSGQKPGTVLKYGSRGEDVKRLQEFLNSQLALYIYKQHPIVNGKEISHLAVDGIFGAETRAAVVWYFGAEQVSTTQF